MNYLQRDKKAPNNIAYFKPVVNDQLYNLILLIHFVFMIDDGSYTTLISQYSLYYYRLSIPITIKFIIVPPSLFFYLQATISNFCFTWSYFPNHT